MHFPGQLSHSKYTFTSELNLAKEFFEEKNMHQTKFGLCSQLFDISY